MDETFLITSSTSEYECQRLTTGLVDLTMSIPISLVDLEENLTYVNVAFLKRILSGEKVTKLVEVLQKWGNWVGELISVRNDGSVFGVQVSPSTLVGEVVSPVNQLGSFIEVTTPESTEMKPKNERDRFQQYLDGVGIIAVMVDTEFKISMINKRGAEVFEYPTEEILGKDFALFLPVHVREAARTRFFQAMAGLDVYEQVTEGVGITKSGEERIIVAYNTVLYDNTGKIIGMLSSGIDITELKQTRLALQESENRYRAIFETAHDAITITSREGRYIDINPATVELLGYTRDELHQINARELYVHPEARTLLLQELEMQGAVKASVKLKKKDGTVIDCLFSSTARRTKKGEFLGYQSIIRDITMQRRAAALLRAERDKAELYLDVAGVLIIALDANQKVTMINKKGCELLGYSEDEVLGKDWVTTFFPARIRDERRIAFHQVLIGKREPRLYNENPVLTKNGEERLIAWRNAIIRDSTGQITSVLCSGTDITEQTRAEAALRNANEFSERLINSSVDGILAFDYACRYTVWNPGMERLSGVSKEEVLGKCAFDVFPFLKQTGEDQFMLDALTGKTVSAKDRVYFIPETNRQGFFESRYSPLRTETGGIIGGLGIIQETTERKKIEDELRIKDYAIEASINAVALANLDGALTHVNPAFLRMWGYGAAQEVLGKPTISFWRQEAKASEVVKSLQERGSYVGELVAIQKDGTLFDVQLSANMVLDKLGRPVSMMATFIDITERKKVEKALRESEAQYSALVEQGMDGVLIIQDGAIKFSNRAMTELSGYTFDELLNRSILKWGISGSKEHIAQRYQTHMTGESNPLVYETQIQCKDGTKKDVEISSGLIQYKAQPAIMGLVRDITARKKVERDRLDLEASRINFVEVTSHELRTPLTAISGFGEFLELHWDELDQESRTRSFEAIRRNVRRLEKLTEDVSSLGQIERADLRLNIKAHNLCNFLVEALHSYQASLESQLEIQHYPEMAPTIIEVDADRIQQVLGNLMDNAIKNTSKEHRKILVASEVFPTVVHVTISDNGAGIDSQDLDRIFEQFVSIPTEFSTGGTGIGLYLSRKFVEAHGGTLTICSDGKGHGSTCIVELPKGNSD